MPKRPQLESDIEHLDAFIGISSHMRDYRIAYLINQLMGLTLEKTDDLPVYNPKSDKPLSFSCYTFEDCDRQLNYFLLANAGSEGLLVPSQKEAGYFLLMRGVMSSDAESAIIVKLKSIPNVLTAYSLDQQNIPNIENLLSDLELHEINLKRKLKSRTKVPGNV